MRTVAVPTLSLLLLKAGGSTLPGRPERKESVPVPTKPQNKPKSVATPQYNLIYKHRSSACRPESAPTCPQVRAVREEAGRLSLVQTQFEKAVP